MKLVAKYDKYIKKPTGDATEVFSSLFDITNINGNWLCREDKQFYQNQITSCGKVGYVAGKESAKKKIHPSKRVKKCFKTCSALDPDVDDLHDSSDSDGNSDEDDKETTEVTEDLDDEEKGDKKRYSSAKCAVKLVRKANLSTNKTCKVLKILNEGSSNIDTPSQSGVYKATFKEAELLRLQFKNSLKNFDWCIHFDGKKLDGEKQVVLLKNAEKEIRLAVLSLRNGKAETISTAIKAVLAEYKLHSCIRVIICDTTNTNSGSKNGVVRSLQNYCQQNSGQTPQYIGCQHHVLDRVLKHAMDSVLDGDTSSRNICYPFVAEINADYESLKRKFGSQDNSPEIVRENKGWRDDMKFLYHLTQVLHYYELNKTFPVVHFQRLPK